MTKLNGLSFCFGFRSKSGALEWQRLLVLMFLIPGIIVSEVIITAAFIGYAPNQMKFLLWDNIDFLRVYFRAEPLDTLKFVFIDRPLFIIEARQQDPSTSIWGLHYYSYTVVVHIVAAVLLVQLVKPAQPITPRLRLLAITGAGLLILSSLYLYLSSCCTAGANWIMHTWLLAIVFNPYTSSESIIEMYGYVNQWFVWIQVLFAVLGCYFIFTGLNKRTN